MADCDAEMGGLLRVLFERWWVGCFFQVSALSSSTSTSSDISVSASLEKDTLEGGLEGKTENNDGMLREIGCRRGNADILRASFEERPREKEGRRMLLDPLRGSEEKKRGGGISAPVVGAVWRGLLGDADGGGKKANSEAGIRRMVGVADMPFGREDEAFRECWGEEPRSLEEALLS